MRSHHRPCRVVPRHIQIAAAGTGQVQVAWEPGSLARLVRGSPKIRAPNQRRPAPTRIESLTPLLHHPSSPPLPPVFRWPRPGPSSCDSCSSAWLPLSLSRPTRPYFVSLAPARCFDEFSPSLFPSFPLLNLTGLNSPQDTKRRTRLDRYPQSSSASSRVVRTSFTPTTTPTHVPLSSRRVPCNSRVRQHPVLVSIRSSRPHFHLKDIVSPPSPSRLLNWFAPVRSDEAVAIVVESSQRQAVECRLPRPPLACRETSFFPPRPGNKT